MPFPISVGPSGRFEGPDKSEGHRRRADFIGNLALFALTAPIGGGVVTGVGSRLQPITSGLSFAKRPIHSTLAWKSQWNQPLGKLLNQSLTVRKKVNTLALGYSLLNPMQNVHYISRKDWKRLLINLHSPVVGVPIYELIDSLMSGQSESSMQPSGPPRPIRNTWGTTDSSSGEGGARSPLSPPAPVGGLGDGPAPRAKKKKRGSGIPPRSKKYCKKHKKYDYCHRRRW